MKKLCALALLLVAVCSVSHAQATIVSGTVQDSNNYAYSGASMVITQNGFIVPPGFKLNDAGTFSVNLNPGTYTFTANFPGIAAPLGTGPQTCTLANQVISGATQTLTFGSCPSLANTSSSGGIGYPPSGVPSSSGVAWGSSYAVGTGDNDLVQLTGAGALPAVSAANLTNFPTLNQNTTGSSAKWTTARNLAGNSVDGSANVPFSNKFIVQGTSDSGLSGAQFLGALNTGILKNTTATGFLSIAIYSDIAALWTTGGTCSSVTYLRGDGSCTTPTGSISGLTTGFIPLAGSATSLTGNSHMDDGITNTGVITSTEPITATNLTAGSAPSSAGTSASGGIAFTESASTGWTPTAGQDYLRADSTTHTLLCSQNGAAEAACVGGGANTALSNLASVNINTSLLAQTGVDLGSTTKPFRNLFFFGAGTYATTYFELTGTPTSTRTWTLQDATDTFVGRATTDTLTNKSIALTEVNSGLTSGGVVCATSTTVPAMTAALTANVFPKGGGAGVCPTNSSVTDNATTVTTTDTGGYVAPVFVSSGTTAGFSDFPQGTTSAAVAPCNTATSICWQAPTAVTSYLTTLPGVAPDIASYKQTDGCAAAACTETFHPVPVLLTVASDFTDSTSTSLQLITGLSTTLPVSKAVVVSFHCGIIFDQASAVVSDQFGIGITGTAPTQANAGANVFITASTVTAGTLTALASTTPTAVVTFTPGVATTIYRAEMDGTVEQPSNATPGVLGFYVATTTGTDNIIVKRGSFCSVQYQ